MKRAINLVVITFALSLLVFLPRPENDESHGTVRAIGNSLPRDRAIWTAEDFRSYEWYADWCNVAPDTCYTGYRSFFGPGAQSGVAYKWGGWDTIAQFQTKLGQCSGAGDRPDDDGVRGCTTGVDCSGFIQRVWELTKTEKQGTWHLAQPDISYPIEDWQRLRADIYNNITSHAMLYYADVDSSRRWFYEARWGDGKVRLNQRLNSELAGYAPYRYNNITYQLHTYLPYVKVDAYTSTLIRVTEMTGGGASTVTFYNSYGSVVASTSFWLPANGTQTIIAGSYVSAGLYAVQVSSDLPVAVTAEIDSTPSGFETDAYAGMTNGSDKIYIPLVMRDWGGRYTDYNIMNIGINSANVKIEYFKTGGSGSVPAPRTLYVSPQGFANIDVRSEPGWVGSVYGTAVISSGDTNALSQIIVTARQRKDTANASVVFNGLNSEDTRQATRAPLIMNDNAGWVSGLQVQNAGSRATGVAVDYYWADGGLAKQSTANIDPNNAATFYAPNEGLPAGFVGSAVVSNYGQPLASIINFTNYYNARTMAHEGSNIGAYILWAPAVRKGTDYNAGIQVQNIGLSQATVYVYYYNNAGNLVSSEGPIYLNPGVSHTLYQSIPSGFEGSARISSNVLRLAVITNLQKLGWSGDTDKSYTAPIPWVDYIYPW